MKTAKLYYIELIRLGLPARQAEAEIFWKEEARRIYKAHGYFKYIAIEVYCQFIKTN